MTKGLTIDRPGQRIRPAHGGIVFELSHYQIEMAVVAVTTTSDIVGVVKRLTVKMVSVVLALLIAYMPAGVAVAGGHTCDGGDQSLSALLDADHSSHNHHDPHEGQGCPHCADALCAKTSCSSERCAGSGLNTLISPSLGMSGTVASVPVANSHSGSIAFLALLFKPPRG